MEPQHIPKTKLSELIATMDDDLDFRAAAQLAAVVRACTETGNKGRLVLTLAVEPKGNGKHLITPRLETKEPRPSPSPSVFFSDDGGNLFRNHPNQLTLPFPQPAKAGN